MKFGILEILGLFLVVLGGGSGIAAAAMVSVALAVLVTAVLLVFGGVTLVYVATVLSKAEATPAKPGGDRT